MLERCDQCAKLRVLPFKLIVSMMVSVHSFVAGLVGHAGTVLWAQHRPVGEKKKGPLSSMGV
jgi:hypothetical protein